MLRWLINSLIIFSFLLIATPSFSKQITGTLMVVKGEVTVLKDNKSKEKKAKVGMKVRQGDVISCGKDSRAKIVMADKNIIHVSPESKLSLDEYDYKKDEKKVMLNVIYGKIRSSVNQKYDGEKSKFQVKTPTAVAGVRGTDFLTSYAPRTKTSQIVTFKGLVAVGRQGPNNSIVNPVIVKPGQFTKATATTPPEPPKKVPPKMFENLEKESNSDTDDHSNEETNTTDKKKEDKNKDKEEADNEKQEDDSKKEDQADNEKQEDDSKKEDQADNEKQNKEGKKEQANSENKKRPTSNQMQDNSDEKSDEEQNNQASDKPDPKARPQADTKQEGKNPKFNSVSEGERKPSSNMTDNQNKMPSPDLKMKNPEFVDRSPNMVDTNLDIPGPDIGPVYNMPNPMIETYVPPKMEDVIAKQPDSYLDQVNDTIKDIKQTTRINIEVIQK